MIHKVDFRICEDDHGDRGLIPAKIHHHQLFYKFNAAWNARFIMHDIFEHWFELDAPFVGRHEIEPDGEIAAMGACWYYLSVLRPSTLEKFFYNQNIAPDDNIVASMAMPIENATGNRMLKLPYIRKNGIDLSFFAEGILNYKYEEQSDYINSMSKLKIERLMRWGYNKAEKLIANTYQNAQIYDEIHYFFEDLVQKNDRDYLTQMWDYLSFSMKTSRGNIQSWNVQISGYDEVKWLKRGNYTNPYLSDY